MPHVFNHFVLHTLLLPARYCDLSVFAKRETDKKGKAHPGSLKHGFRRNRFNKNQGKTRKKTEGKRCRIHSGTLSPSYDTNRGRPPIRHPGLATFHCTGHHYRARAI
jgi:hypothetical protein